MYLLISDYEMSSPIKCLVFLDISRFYIIRIYNHFIFRNQLIALLLSHLIKLRFQLTKNSDCGDFYLKTFLDQEHEISINKLICCVTLEVFLYKHKRR